jgi:hypothetical protein
MSVRTKRTLSNSESAAVNNGCMEVLIFFERVRMAKNYRANELTRNVDVPENTQIITSR